jgi:glycerate kinase
MAFMNGRLVSGIEAVMRCSHLGNELKSTDWVITGEGRFDRQSLYGKVVAGVSRLAVQSDTRVAVLAGEVVVSEQEYEELGISAVLSCKRQDMSLDYALENCRQLLSEAAKRLAEEYLR